ncbi:MAG: response regulator [Chloroflexi bacterium]|nr:response regulator [Chloroflexota bacterium]
MTQKPMDLSALDSRAAQLFNLGTGDLHSLARQVAAMATEDLNLIDCAVFLLDEPILMNSRVGVTGMLATGSLVRMAQYASSAYDASDGPNMHRTGLATAAVRSGESIYVPDVETEPLYFHGSPKTKSELIVPLHVGDRIIGALDLQSATIDAFDKQTRHAVKKFAGQAGVALQNARLYGELRYHADELEQHIDKHEQAKEALQERTAELSAANASLERALRAKDEFLANMSHELRTPLSAILGKYEILQEELYGPLNEKQHSSLGIIGESGRHLLSLINDILDLAKLESGKTELDFRPVFVQSVCRASLQFVKQIAFKKGIKVSFTADENVRALLADERRLKQILVNLLSNAVKFTPEGGRVGLKVTGNEAQEVVRFSVWDTGIGIAEEDVGYLFHPFVQLDNSLTRAYEGTGLGLSLVYRLTEMHGGSVSVRSKLERGSNFTAAFPWRKRDEGAAVDGDQTEIKSEVEVTKNARVLLVEDNEISILTIQNYLTLKGYQVVVARNGSEAIERAGEKKPDIILMDIQMPKMDGLEATRRIRNNSMLADIPIIALTALAMPDDRERCLAAGANEYVSKPPNLRQLTALIEAQLRSDQNGEGIV